jgi:hypothetical protein
MHGASYDGMMRTPVAGRLGAAAAPLPPHASTAYRAAFGRHERYDGAGMQWMQVSSPILTYLHVCRYAHVCSRMLRECHGVCAVETCAGEHAETCAFEHRRKREQHAERLAARRRRRRRRTVGRHRVAWMASVRRSIWPSASASGAEGRIHS